MSRIFRFGSYSIVFSLFIEALWGWGFGAHRLVNREAVECLDGELKVYYSRHRDYLVEHSIDPDLWRGDRVNHPLEGPGHFIDLDLYDSYPFDQIPRDYQKLLEKFGTSNVERWGFGPWRIEAFLARLTEEMKTGKWNESLLTASALGHYVADLHVPFHTTENYDGQLTGNKGIHRRWESDMVDRFLLNDFTVHGKPSVITNVVDECFLIVKESYPLNKIIFQADTEEKEQLVTEQVASPSATTEQPTSSEYYSNLFQKTGGVARSRMEKAVLRVASLWYSAWVSAGKPQPPTE